jgi:ferredoxin-NADP reductase
MHGPFGRFSYMNHPHEQDLVFIAGGIGVTPLRSMLRHMNDIESEKSVLFIYANSDENNIVFRKELHEIANSNYPRLNLVHVLENPPGIWSGETGLLDREKTERLCKNKLKNAAFYVCGPPGLVETVIANLKDLGVPDKRIHLEIFSFIG